MSACVTAETGVLVRCALPEFCDPDRGAAGGCRVVALTKGHIVWPNIRRQ